MAGGQLLHLVATSPEPCPDGAFKSRSATAYLYLELQARSRDESIEHRKRGLASRGLVCAYNALGYPRATCDLGLGESRLFPCLAQ